MKVAILGASPKPERYSHQAQLLLMERGHEVFPVSPTGWEILGVAGMTSVPPGMDTVTLYLGRDRLIPVLDFLIQAAPRRVIFNPGTESWEATTPFPPPSAPVQRRLQGPPSKSSRAAWITAPNENKAELKRPASRLGQGAWSPGPPRFTRAAAMPFS